LGFSIFGLPSSNYSVTWLGITNTHAFFLQSGLSCNERSGLPECVKYQNSFFGVRPAYFLSYTLFFLILYHFIGLTAMPSRPKKGQVFSDLPPIDR
jgi:hypothetical protein